MSILTRGRHVRRRKSRTITLTILGSAFVLAGALMALAHEDGFIDLTADEAQETHDGAIFTQGGLGAGTGNFDPYLTLSPGGSTPTESGYNVCTEPVFGVPGADCPDPEFDEQTGGDRTHELRVSSIPVIEVGGQLYREFHLDSNDSGADPWMSISVIELYTASDPDLTFSEFTSTGDLIWDLDGTSNHTILMNTQSLESGSGVSDISVLIPNDLFPADCFYGAVDCDTFLYFYTEAGDPTLVAPGHTDKNWNTTAGFEEWRIELLPVVNVEKDVAIEFDRTFPWNVEKTADVETIDLFAGESAMIDWTVTATVGTPVDSDVSITGTIDILNPTGSGFAIGDGIDAVVTDVEDVLTLGAVDTTATVTCPDPFPFTVDPGETVTCTYTAAPSTTEDGTNEATVTIETTEEGETQDYSATAPVDFADADVNEIDECVEVTDDNATPGDTSDDLLLDTSLCANESPGVYNFSTTVGPFDVEDCDSLTITNTAYTETNDTETDDSASDSVDVDCYELTVSKTAVEAMTTTYPWDVTKVADVETIDVFAGESATINWTITATVGTPVDSGHQVEGVITISNPSPNLADDVTVTDVISHAVDPDIDATVDCDDTTMGDQDTVDVPAAVMGVPGTATCEYSAALPDADDRTNTATATLFDIDYEGTAPVDFSGATVTEVDECISVSDDNATPGDTSDDEVLDSELCEDESPGEYPRSTDVGPFDVEDCDSLTITNTASTVTNDSDTPDSSSDSVDVNCYELTVTKDADTTYTRDYDWDIAKTRFIADGEDDGDDDPLTLTLMTGQTFEATYEVTVTMTGFADSEHAVSGTITISNPAPMVAEDVEVTDVISHLVDPDINAVVDCDDMTMGDQSTVDVPAAVMGVPGTATCEYSADLPNADDRTNTATAELFEIDYSGTADVTFDLDNPTVEIDECIDVIDDAGTPADPSDDVDLGTVCLEDLDDDDMWTGMYMMDIGPFEACGEYTFTNTVSFETTDDENDTTESDDATYTVTIDVPCPEGCSLTQGYWKTHNESFHGGAPPDDTWALILPSAEDSPFYLSGQTYFQVMWTAPQGNVYYNLAHQYIAAVLNGLAGADTSVITTELAAAETLFQTYTPAQVAELKGKTGKDLRAQFIALAGTLASYNEGDIGPGHCDEDGFSEAVIALLPGLLAFRRRDEGMTF